MENEKLKQLVLTLPKEIVYLCIKLLLGQPVDISRKIDEVHRKGTKPEGLRNWNEEGNLTKDFDISETDFWNKKRDLLGIPRK